MSLCEAEDLSREPAASISPCESSVKGGKQLLVRFAGTVPDVDVFVVFCGSQQRHEVSTERQDNGTLTAIIPAHEPAEAVELSICHLDENGEQKTLFQTQFSYTIDLAQHMANILVQSVSDRGIPLQYLLFPPLPTIDALREFDCSLTEVFQSTTLPEGWTLTGYDTQEEHTSMADCTPRETLLHFAARHSLSHLTRHLLTLPGAEVAAVLPNEEGHTPLHLSQESSNKELSHLLTQFITQSSISILKDFREDKGRKENTVNHQTKKNPLSVRSIQDKLREINSQWRTQVKYPKASLGNHYYSTSSEHLHYSHQRLPSPLPSLLKPLPKRLATKRRSSVAVMELNSQTRLLPSPPLNLSVGGPSLAEVDRHRKTSWSMVVGNCMSRSVGTGINELERSIAEDSFHKQVEWLQTKLVEMDQYDSDLVQHSRVKAQVNLLYGLSVSCPILNNDSESVTPSSAILSAATSPGMDGSSSSEEEETGRSTDLIMASASHPLHRSLEMLSSGQSDSSFSRTDTCSSTSSQQRSVSIPKVITTEHDTVYSVDQASNQSAENELNGEGSHEMSCKSLSGSTLTLDKDEMEGEKLEEEDAVQTEAGVSTSISAPDLLAIVAENGVTVSELLLGNDAHSALCEEDQVDFETHSRTAPVSSSSSPQLQNRSQNGTGKILDPQADQQLETSVPNTLQAEKSNVEISFSSICTQSTDQNTSSTIVDLETNVATTSTPVDSNKSSTPINTSSKFNKSHRRSLSTSEMEISTILWEQKRFGTMESNYGEEGEDNIKTDAFPNASEWPIPTVSKTVGNITAAGSTLSLEDRSRGSSLRTNETSSRHESEDSSVEDDDILSAQQSLTSISRSSLDPEVSSKQESGEMKGHVDEHDGVLGRKRRLLKTGKNRNAAVNNIDGYSSDDEPSHGRSRGHKTGTVTINKVPHDSEGEDECSSHNSSKSAEPAHEAKNARHQVSNNLGSSSAFEPEHDIALSDVDVKFVSDDSNISSTQSLENSYERSHHSSSFLFPDNTRSQKANKKWHSPLLKRKAAATLPPHAGDSPTPRRKGGLTKADVTPTIQTLKELLGSTSNNALSDDSDTTIHAEPRLLRPKSAAGTKSSTISIQRRNSTASDSVIFKEDLRKQATLASCVPLPQDSTSLDFPAGGSCRTAQTTVETPPHFPPPFSSRNKTPPPANKKKKESDEFAGGKRMSEASADAKAFQGKLRTATSYDETAFRGNSNILSSSSSYELRPHSEEEPGISVGRRSVPAEGELEPKDGDEISIDKLSSSEPGPENLKGGVKKFIRDAFSRGSKHNRKTKSRSGSTHDTEPSMDAATINYAKVLRGKSAKMRPKLESSTFEEPRMGGEDDTVFVSPRDKQTVVLRRSESVQVHMDTRAFGTTILIHSGRRDSDSSLTHSPTKTVFDTKSLSPLEETPMSSSTSIPISRHATAPPTVQSISPTLTDSEPEETAQDDQFVQHLSASYPELAIQEEQSWDKTIDRKVYRKLNKAERERQAVLHELLQTERHHLRALHVLKLIFHQNIVKILPEDVINQMFPELDNLIEISDNFVNRLEERKSGSAASNMIEDFTDVLYDQFSGETRKRLLHSFGGFASGHLTAIEVYKEQLKKKPFARLMKDLHRLKECQRLTLPDYYTQVSLRLTKVLTLMQRLVKRTESLKLSHAPKLRQSMENLQQLVSDVDQAVDDHKNRVELMDVQSRLEITPKSTKHCNWKKIKDLNLMAQERKLRKRGDAVWMGHGKHLPVHVVLVTDFLVLLTERDQKYHLAALQDLKPPVIRLYDLHVRLNAAVKSGVQLYLLEQGDFPEMFKLEFSDKKEAKGWQTTLNNAVEECKEKGLKCEYFGSERMLSGDEEHKPEEKEGDGEEACKTAKKPEVPDVSPSFLSSSSSSPSLTKLQLARESLEIATRLLSTPTITTDATASQRHMVAGTLKQFRDSPKNKLKAHTGVLNRPKTASTERAEEHIESTQGDNLSVLQGVASKVAKVKSAKKVTRTSTFKSKDRDREKEKEKDKGGGGSHTAAEASEGAKIQEQQYVDCITRLKESLEDMVNENEEKDDLIGKLRNEIESLRESLAENRREQQENSSQVVQRISPRGSPQQPRPHSYHVGLSDKVEDTGEEGGTGDKVEDSRELVLSPSTTGSTHDSEYESSDTSTLLVVEHV